MAGWERKISPKTQRSSYRRPMEGGRRLAVSQKRDLSAKEIVEIADILFPPKKAKGDNIAAPNDNADEGFTDVAEDVVAGGNREEEESIQEHAEHAVELASMARVLKELSRSSEMSALNIEESVSDLDDAMRDQANPLRQKLPLKENTNFFVDVLKFAIKKNKAFVYAILKHSSTNELEFDSKTVILVAKIYIIVASSINPEVNSAYRKVLGVFLQSCGLTNKGISALNQLGECESVRTLQDTKTDLAVLDEENVKKLAKMSTPATAFDNMDKRAHKTLQHYTLPVQLFPNPLAVPSGDGGDGLDLDEVVKLVDFDYLDLNSTKNKAEKDAFLKVVYTVLSDICSTIPHFEWTADIFPLSHDHLFKATASLKTERHTDTTINLACMKTSDVIKVLEILIKRYLTLLAERLENKEDKERYSRALSDLTSESVGMEELRQAEGVVTEVIKMYGKLILFGNQKTVEDVQTAIEARKDGFTDLEAFAYIMIVIPGDFHLEMAATMKTAEVLLSTTSSQNKLTLGALASRLCVAHRISNDPSVIKRSGNYEENRQFPALVATEFLRDGLAQYKAECEAGSQPVLQSEAWLSDFFNSFLDSRSIRLWFDSDAKPTLFDDVQSYASNLVSRVLLQLVHRHAVKYGDPVALRACHKIYVIFFYSHNGNRSKYSPTLLHALADYERLSSLDKNRVDLLCSINTTGEEGAGAAADMVNEWAVGETKPMFDRFANSYEITLVDRAMKAQNIISILKNDFLASLGREDLISKKSTSTDYFKEIKEELREEVVAMSPLCPNPDREKIKHNVSYQDLWEDMNPQKIAKMIAHKMELYEGSRMTLL